MSLTSTDVQFLTDAATKGAFFLDEVREGWYLEIDTEILRLESCHKCVLGQLFGDYWNFDFSDLFGEPYQYGFDVYDGDVGDSDYFEITNARYEELRQIWIALIEVRRTYGPGGLQHP